MVLSRAIILVAKSAQGDCETALASLLGFLIGFVIADLCRVKAARERIWAPLYKIQSFQLWPSSQGQSVHSCSLWRRWPGFGSLPVLVPADHPSTPPSLLNRSSSLGGHFLHHHRVFPPLPPFYSPHPSAWPSRGSLIPLRSTNFHTFPGVGCQHLFSASVWHRCIFYNLTHSCI